ncbi:MAG: hypothetical protein Harvfovirus27_14 [Harvfovirus sp.]|uniref:Uncharacterized protein n=1 Tax=Harvfovirus sp. TaxID=2487768 RepID=A0A3G5A299_9VIRU|nr:MAG: hypothetical protein Harvfovirus27_14 [Harvfovirus sp.]
MIQIIATKTNISEELISYTTIDDEEIIYKCLPEQQTENKIQNIVLKLKHNTTLIELFDYDLMNDGASDPFYTGAMNVYDLNSFNITICDKKLNYYYKILIEEENEWTLRTSVTCLMHVFIYEDESFDVIRTEFFNGTACKVNILQDVASIEPLNTNCDIIGFTSSGIICATELNSSVPKDNIDIRNYTVTSINELENNNTILFKPE